MLRKIIAVFCIGLVLFAAFTPGDAAHTIRIDLELVWIVFVSSTPTFIPDGVRVAEQTARARFRSFVAPSCDLA
jgi:hypothetical protein